MSGMGYWVLLLVCLLSCMQHVPSLRLSSSATRPSLWSRSVSTLDSTSNTRCYSSTSKSTPSGGADVGRRLQRAAAASLLLSTLLSSTGSFLPLKAFAATSTPTNSYVYLDEPTDEFKEEVARTAAYNAAQAKIRKEWDGVMERFGQAETPAQTEQALVDMKQFLVTNGNIPVGLKKRDVVKTCRQKKFNGKKVKATWTTSVEIAYENFIQELNKKLLPASTGDKTI